MATFHCSVTSPGYLDIVQSKCNPTWPVLPSLYDVLEENPRNQNCQATIKQISFWCLSGEILWPAADHTERKPKQEVRVTGKKKAYGIQGRGGLHLHRPVRSYLRPQTCFVGFCCCCFYILALWKLTRWIVVMLLGTKTRLPGKPDKLKNWK